MSRVRDQAHKDDSAYKEALRVIRDAAARGATQLDLSKKDLTSLPPQIAQLKHLRHLFVRDNRLTRLPLEVAQLTNLTQLFLAGNQFTSLPPEISQLAKLERLEVDENLLTDPPPEISGRARRPFWRTCGRRARRASGNGSPSWCWLGKGERARPRYCAPFATNPSILKRRPRTAS